MQYSCYNTLSMCPSSYTQYIHDSSGRQCNMVRSIVVVSLLLLRALALEQVKLSVVWLECTLLLGSHWLVYADMYYIYDTHVIKTLKVQFKNMRRGFKLFKLKKSCVDLHQYHTCAPCIVIWITTLRVVTVSFYAELHGSPCILSYSPHKRLLKWGKVTIIFLSYARTVRGTVPPLQKVGGGYARECKCCKDDQQSTGTCKLWPSANCILLSVIDGLLTYISGVIGPGDELLCYFTSCIQPRLA